ncbi:TNT domain-containing protein [Cryobacterium suzukii]|uniref:TNT domain-containing protein n=1 Tax=Cryobacterium suzukii TaxID=1259198 RepID=UPI00141BBFE8|nr:TNT domain-containing protein [Cryobacterium suzukii]
MGTVDGPQVAGSAAISSGAGGVAPRVDVDAPRVQGSEAMPPAAAAGDSGRRSVGADADVDADADAPRVTHDDVVSPTGAAGNSDRLPTSADSDVPADAGRERVLASVSVSPSAAADSAVPGVDAAPAVSHASTSDAGSVTGSQPSGSSFDAEAPAGSYGQADAPVSQSLDTGLISAADSASPQGLSPSSADASGVGGSARPAGLASVAGDGAPSAGTPSNSVGDLDERFDALQADLDERFDQLTDDISADFDKLEADTAASLDRIEGDEAALSSDGAADASRPVDAEDLTHSAARSVDSSAAFGPGWERTPAGQEIPRSDGGDGQTYSKHGQSETYPTLSDGSLNAQTGDLMSDPDTPYGRHADGVPMTKAEYDERYVQADRNRDRYPSFDGVVPGTRVTYTDASKFIEEYGSHFDRVGKTNGAYLGLVEDGRPATFEARGLPISSLRKPYSSYSFTPDAQAKLSADGIRVEISRVAPAFGREGGALQVRFLKAPEDKTRSDFVEVKVELMLERGYLK